MKLRVSIVAVALAGSCAGSQTAPVAAPKAVAELAGRSPGKSQRCVTGEPGVLFRVSDSDPHLLLYDDRKTIWASVLAPSCGFEAGQTVGPDVSASYYCHGDFVRARSRIALLPFGHTCVLGDFTPYSSAK
jgi:hypothetical protein